MLLAGCRSPAGFILEIDVSELLAVAVADDAVSFGVVARVREFSVLSRGTGQ
jgi:hypothetical protein